MVCELLCGYGKTIVIFITNNENLPVCTVLWMLVFLFSYLGWGGRGLVVRGFEVMTNLVVALFQRGPTPS